MKKHTNRFTSAALALIIIALCVQPAFAAAPQPPAANSAKRHQVCTELSDEAERYYSGQYSYAQLFSESGAKDSTYSYAACKGNKLYSALHSLMDSTHTYKTSYSGYKAGSLAYYWQYTDAVSSSTTYIMFYSDIMADKEGVEMNREHIWPKSRASYSMKNGGADLHHLRPSVSTVNAVKSDHTFGYVRNAFADGYKTGIIDGEALYWTMNSYDLFECKDDVKGDVARILLYVYCRWGQPNLHTDMSDMTESLPAMDSDDKTNSGQAVIESLDTLLQWCEDDPVDTWEMKRNDLVQQVQGNRNVFIDYPELAWKMFSKPVPSGLTTPTHDGCEHSWAVTQTKAATQTDDGYRKVKCSECGEERVYTIHASTKSDYKGFPDVKQGSWYYDAVKYVAERGYITGYQNKKFGPGDSLKRQDFVLILARIAGAELSEYEGKSSKLSDVSNTAYYAPAVNWAVDNGIISGYQNGKFGVNDNITREQVATILYRYMSSPDIKDVDVTLSKFSDANRVSGFAKTAVVWAVQNGVISGMADGRVASTDGASRAQIASIIQRMDTQGMFNKSDKE
ncbi:MAG: endonuclease [Clostridia bacterium]|nr:endonuclease [Clostridia bacterium]